MAPNNECAYGVVGGILTGVVADVRVDDEAGQVFVLDGVNRVADDAQNIETRQDRLR